MLKKTLLMLAAFSALAPGLTAASPPKPFGAVPTPQQVDWLRMELYAFVHFGLNTYTNREWGYGDESPKLFNPSNFDADAIVATFKKAGMTGMIYTAKHHDGWCAWPTKSTKHNITQSPWKKGKGDVVKEFARACRKYGLKFGTYLSPWDRNCAEYGRPGYLDVYYKQIKELLRYGPIFEIWFDGANGGDGYYGGAREKRNIGKADEYYNFEKVVSMIRKIQPDCIIWGAGGHGDATWGGSEQGFVRLPNWNVINRDKPDEKWISLEGDTPINRAGWFWHPGQASKVKTPEHLMQVYLDSVGRGANLILNVAPDRDGRLDKADVASLLKFGENRKRLLARDYAQGAKAQASEVRGDDTEQFGADKLTDGDIETYWAPNDGTTKAELIITTAKPVTFDVVRIREQIRLGQRVKDFRLEAKIGDQWEVIDPEASVLMQNQQGKAKKDQLTKAEKTIGHQIMRRLPEPITTDQVKLVILDARACPCISELSLLRMPREMPTPTIERKGDKISISTLEQFDTVYTTDGSDPGPDSPKVEGDIRETDNCVVKAAYIDRNSGEMSGIGAADLGISKADWESPEGKEAFDDDATTLWKAKAGERLTIKLGGVQRLTAFSYLPRQDGSVDGMTDRYVFEVSADGKKWRKVAQGEFSNLRANPIEQKVDFDKTVKAAYIRFTGTRALEGNEVTAAEINVFAAKSGPKTSKSSKTPGTSK